MENAPKINIRMNTAIFKCILEGKWYNLANTQAYAIGVAIGLVPQGQQAVINLDSQLICETCWKANQSSARKDIDNLNFKEPSPIVGVSISKPAFCTVKA